MDLDTLWDFARFAGLVLAVLAFLRWHIWEHPWMECRRCGGASKKRTVLRGSFGYCRRCKGTGKELRWMAKILRFNPETGARR